ncbi:MAG TPA: glycosyltransferase [Solirubrobacteraceae bacterium]|nr:glycosyltransferase [Solirubrobacteraceae bacterium]
MLLLFEPPDGGVAAHVAQLARGLPAHGWDVTVAGPPVSATRTGLEDDGLRYVGLGSLRRGYGTPAADARSLRAIRALLRGGVFDVVHCHSSKAGLLGRLAAGSPSAPPVVYSPHCFGFVGDVSRRRRELSLRIERTLARRTRAVICVSEAEAQQAREQRIGAPGLLHRVDNGVSTAEAGPADPELLEFRGDGLLVGAVTALREQKRVDVLLDSAHAVLDAIPDARIAIVGDGPLRGELTDRARRAGLLAGGRVRFFRFAGSSVAYLRALDVYVLPSAWEAMPIGALEALAAGVPQVASNVDGLDQIVTAETGILVTPKNPAELSRALIALLSDGARRERAAGASRRRHALRFEAGRMVAETSDVYDHCLRERAPIELQAA